MVLYTGGEISYKQRKKGETMMKRMWGKYQKTFTIILLGIFLLGCEDKSGVAKKEKKAPRSEQMNHYVFANSTDIYSLTGHYAIDGTDARVLSLNEPAGEYYLEAVNDSWLYYYEYVDGPAILKRIPLKKGEDGRDIMDVSHKERIRDMYNDQGFTIVGDYYAAITYGTVGLLYNMNTKEKVSKKVPEIVQYPKDMEMEDKDWYVLEKGSDWVLWGGNGIILQTIPSGEITVINSKDADLLTESSENDLIFSEDEHSCFLYDINKMKKEKLVDRNEIHDAICKGMKRSKNELKSFHIESIFTRGSKYYLQIAAEFVQDKGYLKRYVMLSQTIEQRNELAYDPILNEVLEENGTEDQKIKSKSTIKNNMKYICNIDGYWFLEEGEKCYCFNEKSNSFKEITAADPERNILYAVDQEDEETDIIETFADLW